MKPGNLFDDRQAPPEGERFEALLAHRNVVIERIVSSAVVTPAQYVQPQDEWVVLLSGEASLDVAGECVRLRSGDHLFLPANTPHTVRQVSAGALWLAVHVY